jgi:hypothetical protein
MESGPWHIFNLVVKVGSAFVERELLGVKLHDVVVVEQLRGRESPELAQQVPSVMRAGNWSAERRELYDAHGDGHRREAARAVRRDVYNSQGVVSEEGVASP